ncbi:MAG: hypothetical protein IT328_20130 [Caldilineaceae bacterium]|nr:hypothetical protein [Caldilineaceae bacterium]
MASKIQIKQIGTTELWEQFSRNPVGVYTEISDKMKDAGYNEAPTLSRALEVASPTEKGEPDAYRRMLRAADIRTKSDPEAGYWASEGKEFFDGGPGARMLMMEFYAREWRKVSFANRRAVQLSGDGIVGSFERPWAEASSPRDSDRVESAIPLSELVALTTPITGNAYRTFYFEYDAEKARLYRVGESADIPMMTVKSHKNAIDIFKYGGGIQSSYEELRRMRVDRMAYLIQRMAVQTEIDKVATVLDVMVNGDGNPNTTPTSYNLTALDTGAQANTLTLKAWLAFKMKFEPPYVLTSALMQADEALQVAMLNTGSANVPLVQVNLGGLGTGAVPMNRFSDSVRYGWLSGAPDNKIVAFDRRFAIERVVEIGSNITEYDRFITNQTQIFTMTEVEGYAVMDAGAVKILNLAA